VFILTASTELVREDEVASKTVYVSDMRMYINKIFKGQSEKRI
jgi:hypothetical protein